jgi:hypothetical protein
VAAGAVYEGRWSGKWHFEVEVLEARGDAFAGIAGTNFRGATVGGDEAAWAVYTDGDTYHRFTPTATRATGLHRRRHVPQVYTDGDTCHRTHLPQVAES